jgi:hypothetical protein
MCVCVCCWRISETTKWKLALMSASAILGRINRGNHLAASRRVGHSEQEQALTLAQGTASYGGPPHEATITTCCMRAELAECQATTTTTIIAVIVLVVLVRSGGRAGKLLACN